MFVNPYLLNTIYQHRIFIFIYFLLNQKYLNKIINLKKYKYEILMTTCKIHITVKHILTDCLKYENLKKKNNLSEQLFKISGPKAETKNNVIHL